MNRYGKKTDLDDSVRKWWSTLMTHVQEDLVCEFLRTHPQKGWGLVCDYLDRNRHYSALGQLLKSYCAGQYYSPMIVKAAEAFEKAGDLKKALELYKEGVERCNPCRIQVYDERTGGEVSAVNYPELNQAELEEAERLVEKCQQKVLELRKKIAERQKRKGEARWKI